MASKSAYQSTEKGAEIEEALNELEKLLERLRAIYEQYFLGIAKTAPTTLHTEAERRIRDLTQVQIKNTALRYRFATLSQKFSAYNSYWKRTMRMIEQGKYVRDLQRVKRQAERNGEAIPEEILAAMPKAMRDRVARDRANVAAIAERKGQVPGEPAVVRSSTPGNMHRLDDALSPDDVDVESMFATLTQEAEDALDASPPIVTSKPPKFDEFDGITSPNLPALPPEYKDPPAAQPPRRKVAPSTPPFRPPSAMRGGGTPPPLPPRPQTTAASPPPVPPPRPQTVVGPPPPPPPARPSAMPPATRAGSPPMAKPPAPPPGMNDNETRALYQKYLKARELCGENNDGVTYDKLMRTLRSQSSKIMSDARVKGVEFGVVIKDNKVVLKAKPKV